MTEHTELAERFAEMRKQIHDRDVAVAELNHQCVRFRRDLIARDAMIAELQDEISELRTALVDAVDTLSAIAVPRDTLDAD